jgi:cytohesin
MLRFLLQNGADPNAEGKRPAKQTPLHITAIENHRQAASFLLENGAHINARYADGPSALYLAVEHGSMDVAQLLIGKQIEVNHSQNEVRNLIYLSTHKTENQAMTMLLTAAYVNSILGFVREDSVSPQERQILKRYCDAGASLDLHLTDNVGGHPIHRATQGGDAEAIKLLLRLGAHVDSPTAEENMTPLHIAIAMQSTALVQLLLENGAGTEVRFQGGLTALHIASRNAGPEIAQLLVNRGADIMARTETGATPLHDAVLVGNLPMILFLTDRGADVNAIKSKPKGETPLHTAILAGKEQAVELLLNLRADVEAVDADGRNALQLATQNRVAGIADMITRPKR